MSRSLPTLRFLAGLTLALLSSPLVAQSDTSAAGRGCPIHDVKNGQAVKFRARAFPGGHDAFLRPEGCGDARVILVEGDHASLGQQEGTLQRDASLERFQKLFREQKGRTSTAFRFECPAYAITADFEGVMDVATDAGLKRNAQTGKVDVRGFEHPVPYTRYRLRVTRISNIEAVRAPGDECALPHRAVHAREYRPLEVWWVQKTSCPLAMTERQNRSNYALTNTTKAEVSRFSIGCVHRTSAGKERISDREEWPVSLQPGQSSLPGASSFYNLMGKCDRRKGKIGVVEVVFADGGVWRFER